ncbi:hypothetical protein ABK040_003589 [Willaertia magna]
MKFNEKITFEEIRKIKEAFVKERDWEKYHTPRNLLLAMIGEVGELSEIFQWKGEVMDVQKEFSESEKENLEDELSDVLVYLIRLADVCKVDLPSAALKKIEKNAIKYPSHLVKGSAEKYTAYRKHLEITSGDNDNSTTKITTSSSNSSTELKNNINTNNNNEIDNKNDEQ